MAGPQPLEGRVRGVRRDTQGHAAQASGHGLGHRMVEQALGQGRRARRAQRRGQPRLGLARHRGFGEDDHKRGQLIDATHR